MVVKIVPNAWAATTTYSQGDAVQHNGIRFTATTAITGNSNNEDPITNIATRTSDLASIPPGGITSISTATNAVIVLTTFPAIHVRVGDTLAVSGVREADGFNRNYYVTAVSGDGRTITTNANTTLAGSAATPRLSSAYADVTSSWQFSGVLDIVDYYSLQYAIQEIINVDDPTINDSIPAFIQQGETLIGKVLRSPAQLERRIFTVDTESRFAIPGDLLEVSHMRRNTDDASYDLRSRGSISIVRAADRESWERLNQYYANTGPWFENSANYTFPYWITDNTYFYIAPSYDVGTEIELEYYQTVPQLGNVVGRVNEDYEPVNSAGQTLAQWIASDSNNNAGNFVQEQITITANLWTATQPNLLKAAACVEAYRYLNNAEQTQVWEQQFATQLAAAETEFSRFEASGPAGLQQESAYC